MPWGSAHKEQYERLQGAIYTTRVREWGSFASGRETVSTGHGITGALLGSKVS